MAVDVSKYTIDTPVLIKIMYPVGLEIPELNTKVPLESYASIAQIISIMNRGTGVDIQFPKESTEHEISKKIEDIMLDYKAKVEIAEEKGYIVENDIETALDAIQLKNETSMTEKEKQEELDHHLFDYPDILERIYNNLRGSELDRIFETDDYKHGVDIIKEAEKKRKAEERVKMFKSGSLKERNKYDLSMIRFTKNLVPHDDPIFTENIDIEFITDK